MSALDYDATGLGSEYEVDTTILSPPQRSNALATKLSTILSTSFADADIREALRTLDERGTQNTPEFRRRLRLDAQREVIERNGDIIKDFGHVAEQLKRIGSTIDSLNRCCEDLRQHVATAHRETGPVLEEATTLFIRKQEIDTKKQILDAFNAHFVISDDDLESLISPNTPVDDRFFTNLPRLKKVHKDCQVLLGSENQQLGLELMDKSSRDLNAAFQKLYRWIQKEFRNLNLENPQMNASIRRSLRVLAERPTLFQSCLDFFAESRERNLSDSFYAALTGTSSNSQAEDLTTKPIEFNAHEPLRFVGDLLAWTHSATVSERESLEVLFVSEGDEIAKGIRAGIESEPWSQENVEAFDGRKSLEQLVNRDLAGVARALRQRVEQVIQSDEDPVLAYKIANLIDFYRVTFDRLLGTDSSVLVTLSALQQSALRQHRTTMQEHVNAVAAHVPKISPGLNVPKFLAEALDRLKELMKSYDSSLAPPESRDAGFMPILADSLDPYLNVCEKMASKAEEPSQTIFSINCLLAAQSSLSQFDFTSERVSEIDDTVDEYVSKLVEYQHAFFLHMSGVHPLLAALAPLTETDEDLKKISGLEPFQKQALIDASQILDEFLPSALMDAMENLRLLKNSRMAEDVTSEAASLFCEDFRFVERKLLAADALYTKGENETDDASDHLAKFSLRTLFPRTSGEIRVLLS
ncbi:Golgi transport complex subunit 6 [Xylographa bjoerkii]|nr:Golgi transport complex subunit 6 [Xylographa bjoerkii]MCJ1395340.1 Golgi transport complex subunit 6 [Xylographa bjoerkii]MCJ1395596.1 Golgi transport complex subunit 6 [Xylographa bjoerkii]